MAHVTVMIDPPIEMIDRAGKVDRAATDRMPDPPAGRAQVDEQNGPAVVTNATRAGKNVHAARMHRAAPAADALVLGKADGQPAA